MTFATLERHALSDGGAAALERQGRTYAVVRSYPEPLTAPDLAMGLSLRDARAALADVLRADVLESD